MKRMLKVLVLLVLVASAPVLVVSVTRAQETPTEVGTAPDGQNIIEFIGHIDQSMFTLTSYGYITYIGGLPGELLFAEDTPALFRDETAAHFTFYATGTADARSNYENIFAATTSANFDIYYNETPSNASFDDPESFATGTLVASFDGRLYSMLNVQEPNIGVLLVHSDTTQTFAEPFALNDQMYQIGHMDQLARFTIFGQGFRASTDPLAASYHIAGDVVSSGTAAGQ